MTTQPGKFGALFFLLVAGILAGAQLGKLAPLVGWYRDTVGFSLVLFGWLTAAIGLFVALVALPAGYAVDRIGAVRTYIGAAVLLAAGGLGVALFRAPGAILAARLVEGVGYLFLVIVIPALLTRIAPPALKAPVMAVWGGFVPIGFAVADFLARLLLPIAPPPVYLVAATLCFAVFAVLGACSLAGVAAGALSDEAPVTGGRGIAATFSAPVLLLTAAFGFFVVLSIAFFAFLPAYALAAGDRLALPAGVVALVVPAGNLVTAALVGGRGPRFAAVLIVAGFAAAAASALPLYAGSDPLSVTLGAVVFAFAGGVVASAIFAAIPFIVPAGGSTAVAIGLVAQAGGIATLVGPPLAGHAVETSGWPALGWLLVAVSAAGLAASVPLLRRRI